MSKVMLKKAGAVATESLLRDLMPFMEERFRGLDSKLDSLRKDIFHLDAKVDGLQRDIQDRFERHLELINEVSHRITKLDGRVEGFMELFGKMFEPVRLPTKRRKAG